ncbi:hypothetical protein DTL42_19490 [Bremerella cremea]|uniref:Uncharacterized protein n=1 Tax=Bremerella cremea TaxID=1031537 RepID=A0A368KPB0_9BACT|nr:hypothetical protein [Bremerella cremea]RCS42256.1 hypothetical protein DTL42_19490 [Bremerella cremea]
MDTVNNLYYYVAGFVVMQNSEETIRLQGFDFCDDPKTRFLDRTSRPLWIIDHDLSYPVNGRVVEYHQQRIGWNLRLTGQPIRKTPFLLTSDSTIRHIYSGPVSIDTDQSSFDFTDAFEQPVPLCGREWIGAVHRINGQLSVDAFSPYREVSEDPLEGFCPWWSEDFQDPDGVIFKVTIGSSVRHHDHSND